MHITRGLLLAALICGTPTAAPAIEGSTLAGPIGGTDIRTAQLPPPGLYGGVGLLAAEAFDFVDAQGKTIPALGAQRICSACAPARSFSTFLSFSSLAARLGCWGCCLMASSADGYSPPLPRAALAAWAIRISKSPGRASSERCGRRDSRTLFPFSKAWLLRPASARCFRSEDTTRSGPTIRG